MKAIADVMATTSGDTAMSEIEQTSGPKTGTWIVIGVVCILVAGGCLVACAGLVGVGFMLPAVRQAQQVQQAERAEAAARQAAENAEAQARAAQQAATEVDVRPSTDETTPQPAANDDAPVKDDPRVEDDGPEGT